MRKTGEFINVYPPDDVAFYSIRLLYSILIYSILIVQDIEIPLSDNNKMYYQTKYLVRLNRRAGRY